VIYSRRLYALEGGEELKAEAQHMIDQAVVRLADGIVVEYDDPGQWDRALIETEFLQKFLITIPDVTDPTVIKNRDDLVRAAEAAGRAAFEAKIRQLKDVETKVGAQNLPEQALSHITLGVIDEKWKDHLYDLDQLREGIYYRAWGQKDPLVEYKQEAYEMFVGLMHDLNATFTERWLKLQIEIGPPRGPGPATTVTGALGGAPKKAPPMVASKPATDGLVGPDTTTGPLPPKLGPPPGAGAPIANPYAGVGRNDPCPCGSGKKFKKCHGAGL